MLELASWASLCTHLNIKRVEAIDSSPVNASMSAQRSAPFITGVSLDNLSYKLRYLSQEFQDFVLQLDPHPSLQSSLGTDASPQEPDMTQLIFTINHSMSFGTYRITTGTIYLIGSPRQQVDTTQFSFLKIGQRCCNHYTPGAATIVRSFGPSSIGRRHKV